MAGIGKDNIDKINAFEAETKRLHRFKDKTEFNRVNAEYTNFMRDLLARRAAK